MTRIAKLYESVRAGHIPSFREFQSLVEAFGFELIRIRGSHHMYRHPAIRSSLNIQPDGRDAKPYQIRQFVAMVAENKLNAQGVQ